MSVTSQLLHQIAEPTLSHNERARLRCRLAKELADLGNYEAAREAMGELWPHVGERPVLDGLDEATAAEVLLRVGALTGWVGSAGQVEGSQETATNLITESLTIFEKLQNKVKIAEAQSEIGLCYWRQGRLTDARIWLQDALSRLPAYSESELRGATLLRLGIVERKAQRLHDALKIHLEAAPLFENSTNHALKGNFHNNFGSVLWTLGVAEKRTEYIDRALIEYAAASYHFEQSGHARYQACVENNLGFLFCTIKKFPEAHHHLDRAQALFTSMKDHVHTAQVDDTRTRVLLAEGRVSEAERLVRSAVQILERGGEQSLLAEALTTHGTALARMGNHQRARLTLQSAVEVAEAAGNQEAAGVAALTILEELADDLPTQDLRATYGRAAELLSNSDDREIKDRLIACSQRVLFLVGALPSPPSWKGFNFFEAVRRFEARLIEGALREAGGVVSRAAQLLGVQRRSLDSMLHRGRHKRLAHLSAPVKPRRSSLMFRDDQDCPDTRAVTVLHVEADAGVADAVRAALDKEGWSVETCGGAGAALERLEGGARYDVLIFGDRLPGPGGVELIRRTRALAHRQRTPIIMFADGGEIETWARRAGANDFVKKSADVSPLAVAAARLLARNRRRH